MRFLPDHTRIIHLLFCVTFSTEKVTYTITSFNGKKNLRALTWLKGALEMYFGGRAVLAQTDFQRQSVFFFFLFFSVQSVNLGCGNS